MPVGQVVGEFDIHSILADTPKLIWEKTKEHSGIQKSFFNKYFDGRERAYAIKIVNAKLYAKPRNLCDVIDRKMPPQSFCYV